MTLEKDIEDSQALFDEKQAELDVLKESLKLVKKGLESTTNPDSIAVYEKCISELEAFIVRGVDILDGHKKCIQNVRAFLADPDTREN